MGESQMQSSMMKTNYVRPKGNRTVVKIAKDKLIDKDMLKHIPNQDDNVPLKSMDNQLVEMDRDYNVMLMERIESKK